MIICQVRSTLFPRDWTDDIKTTGKSFRNWDSCMNDKPCKIIAIVGICLAVVVGLWLIGALLTCCRQGVSGISEFICWCCASGNRNRNNNVTNDGYARNSRVNNIPVMPAMAGHHPSTVIYQPVQQPQTAATYYNNKRGNAKQNTNSYYDEFGRSNNDEVFELEEDFDLEKQKELSNKRKASSKSKPKRNSSFMSRFTSSGNHNTTPTATVSQPYPKNDYYSGATESSPYTNTGNFY
ncbi:Pin2p NDAI_0B04190 [Naumovozyma dairenensis CBS 421]|uniref:[PSI+] induction protein 2 n=1 Tax=Naumovozyma dairenensis (strain ATCC 10597 / BCRC 20456 / CBS 421 / NBRC 0211 / NRRL Y-12639) TaxID=1071378 RepID=G0W6P2_NAUDC|nr:hypothetical protein NDAI_0B04190 [Naumovozyma dairenensis CBS 421]CCD23453.1 hypothetical protein NDAI_0B04190 [Naumovozyma dairenensis CBS 421]